MKTLVLLLLGAGLLYFYIHQYYLQFKYCNTYNIQNMNYYQRNVLKKVIVANPLVWDVEVIHSKVDFNGR